MFGPAHKNTGPVVHLEKAELGLSLSGTTARLVPAPDSQTFAKLHAPVKVKCISCQNDKEIRASRTSFFV